MKKIIIYYPYLLAIYPIFALYTHNIDEMSLELIVRPLVITLFTAVLVFFAVQYITKDWYKTGLIYSLFIFLFYSFGHILLGIDTLVIGGYKIHQYYLLFVIEFILFGVSSLLILSLPKDLNKVSKFLNIFALLLLIIPIVRIMTYEINNKGINTSRAQVLGADNVQANIKKDKLPDIYYIVLDGHARSDVFTELFHEDNSWFIKELENLGFYVAHESTSNYSQTSLSLSSTLNLDYITDPSKGKNKNYDNRAILTKKIKDNKVRKYLKDLGYISITFPSVLEGKDSNADIYYAFKWSLSEFENTLLITTPLTFLVDSNIVVLNLKKQLLYQFENLHLPAQIDAPTFTYMHMLLPHPPFIFDRYGNAALSNKYIYSGQDGSHYPESKEDYIKGYKEQLLFVDKKILETIKEILKSSQEPPIIVLQSDHGSGLELDWKSVERTNIKERMSILNAYYFPDQNYESLYPSITPVNTFRIIFNEYMNFDFNMLEDKNFFSLWDEPYNFIDVTDRLNSQ